MVESVETLEKDIYKISYELTSNIMEINRDLSIYLNNKVEEYFIVNEEKCKYKNTISLDKNESIAHLLMDIDIYMNIYALPPIQISNKEWQLFFNEIYKFCESTGKKENFYRYISIINRKTLAKALVYNQEKIIIENYIDSITYLKEYLISLEKIENIKVNISQYISKNKIVAIKRKN